MNTSAYTDGNRISVFMARGHLREHFGHSAIPEVRQAHGGDPPGLDTLGQESYHPNQIYRYQIPRFCICHSGSQ